MGIETDNSSKYCLMCSTDVENHTGLEWREGEFNFFGWTLPLKKKMLFQVSLFRRNKKEKMKQYSHKVCH